MKMNRRECLVSVSGAAAVLLGSVPDLEAVESGGSRMGVVIHSYGIRQAADKEKNKHFDDPLTFLDYCRVLGAGGAQLAMGVRDESDSAKIRRYLEKQQLFLEGSIRLPRGRNDVERFTEEVRTAKACGAAILRTVLMAGRRYEVFRSADAFRAFQKQARTSLALAKPIVERLAMRLAIENHKDLLSAELLDVVKTVDSEFVGVCLDTGNNLALLENAEEVAVALAPHAFTTHIKDMAVREYPEGFLLSEVPLGTGFLDLAKIVRLLRKARPDIHLNLEMITRDPLKIPCLSDTYWATLDSVSGRRLARALATVRTNAWKQPLPRISSLKREEQIKREDDNVRACLRYARERLER